MSQDTRYLKPHTMILSGLHNEWPNSKSLLKGFMVKIKETRLFKELSELSFYKQYELSKEVKEAQQAYRDYREAALERQKHHENEIANYKGALKQREDEIHVLYHKISTMFDMIPEKFKPENYDSLKGTEQRAILQDLLDEYIEPGRITFGKGVGAKPYTLHRYGYKGYNNVNGDYRDPPLAFC